MARISRKMAAEQLDNKSAAGTVSAPEVYLTGIYLRISSEHNEDLSDQVLDNQEQVVRNYLSDKAEFQIAQVYCDNGCTGTNFKRDAFEQMINDIKAGKINCIIVKDLSRLGRNHIEVEQYLQVIFPFLKVRFIAVNDNYDTLSKDSDITVSLKNIVNAAYAKDISRKIYSAKQVLMEKGMFVGNIPPYGYDKAKDDAHKLVVNKHTSQVVKQIYELKQQGKKYAHIADILNETGEAAPMKYWYRKGLVRNEKYANVMWSTPTIRNILRNRMYLGDMVQGKHRQCLADGRPSAKAQSKDEYIIVKNTHEPIIEPGLFERVQEICDEELQINREKRWRNDNLVNSEYVLENMIYSIDGQKMYRTRNVYANNRISYGYITTKNRRPDGTFFPKFYISENKVYNSLKKVMSCHIELLFSQQRTLKKKNVQTNILKERVSRADKMVQFQKEIEEYREQGALLYKDMVEGKVTFSEYEKLKEKYRRKQEDAKKQLEKLKKEDMLAETHISVTDIYTEQLREFLKTHELTRELTELLVKRVTIIDKNKIQISFRFEDEIQKVYESVRTEGVC